MASNIISDTIDSAYPIAGVDNDTQGFRDNFTVIKTGLATAKSEITTLQSTTAKLNASNDFNGTNIADANIQLQTSQYHNVGTVVSGLNISFLNGHFQTITTNLPVGTTSIAFNLADWPTRSMYSEMTVSLLGNDTANSKIDPAGGAIKAGDVLDSGDVIKSINSNLMDNVMPKSRVINDFIDRKMQSMFNNIDNAFGVQKNTLLKENQDNEDILIDMLDEIEEES